ncbi:hypothetical protein QKU48_gp0167 [Fadolivirus algeromassiliense]|uniref:Uncharacterized protein n=1 Tax=Fadolivirus FV1/VV64 TaxID=3070911 RepID=A0A7D3QTV0_9VIRU|nr:hypothetical protein QKU48_gp0167 [Fadolivirus algeromassiliense]QKF93625.1 hypothetical protein Fadolivirus_1_167 [Fadolivirus FV1/VV64]
MDKIICHPALVYLIVGLIMLCVGVLLKLNTSDLAITFSQLSCIIIVTLILMGLCNIAPQISWVITTIFIICTISIIISIVMNWIAPPLI